MGKTIGKDEIKWDVAWIPEKFAQLGKYIRIKNEDGTWESGWKIKEIYDPRRDKKSLIAGESDYKNQRKVSDV